MKARTLRCLFAAFLCVAHSALAAADEISRLVPIPIAESERVLCHWLKDSGHYVSRTVLESGRLRLTGTRDRERWSIALTPHSPLLTQVHAKYSFDGKPDSAPPESLWSMIEKYTRDFDSVETGGFAQTVPDDVLRHLPSVVCLEASPGTRTGFVQSSGFVIDRTGFIVSTAHDLHKSEPLTVILSHGGRVPGRVIELDHHRDLALVKADFKKSGSEAPPQAVSVDRSRLMLDSGEKLFTIGCPQRLRGVVGTGILSGPPRLADDLPLWQVSMETLPGGSGSPVFDAEGNLVAVVKGRYRGSDAVGFLIPLATVMDFLRR